MGLKNAAFKMVSGGFRLAGRPRRPNAGQRVLLYHSIGTKLPTGMGPTVEIERFKRHADVIAAMRPHWKPAAFGRPSSSALELAVVFDDGYRDALSVAAPLLADRGIPFTVFVIPRYIQENSPYHLTLAQLKELSAMPGAQIGAHGYSHVHLKKADDARLRVELADSRKFLEDALGREMRLMSYPFGSVDRRVRDAAAEAGYSIAGTSRWGHNTAESDPLLLRRTEILEMDTPAMVEWKIHGYWDWYVLRQLVSS